MNAPSRPNRNHPNPDRRDPGAAHATGVIETIAEGMSLSLSSPTVLLVPLLVDGALWSGVALSPAALLRRWTGVQPMTEALGFEANLTPIAAIGIPSLLKSAGADVFRAWPVTRFTPAPWQLTLLTLLGLGLGSALLAMAFRVALAAVVRPGERKPAAVVRSVGVAWVRLVGLIALVFGAIVLVVSPLLVIGAFFFAAGVNVAPLLVAAISVPAIAAMIYLIFAPDAIVLSEAGPFRAMCLSFNVVRRNFWATLGLLGSILLISQGLGVVWRSQVETPIGLLIGVLGNAFVGAGLALAGMRFYLDRLDRWHPAAVSETDRAPTR